MNSLRKGMLLSFFFVLSSVTLSTTTLALDAASKEAKEEVGKKLKELGTNFPQESALSTCFGKITTKVEKVELFTNVRPKTLRVALRELKKVKNKVAEIGIATTQCWMIAEPGQFVACNDPKDPGCGELPASKQR